MIFLNNVAQKYKNIFLNLLSFFSRHNFTNQTPRCNDNSVSCYNEATQDYY